MINLENTCILVKTRKEYEDILNEAEKQGFHWYKKIMVNHLNNTHFQIF